MVGVDAEEQDMLDGNIIYDKMVTCPPICAHNGLV
jgi:hypothetical protein